MGIKAAIFDYDDTLVKTIACKWPALKFLARKYYSFELTNQNIREHWGKPFMQLLEALFGNYACTTIVFANYLEITREFPMQPFPEAAATLTRLAKSIPVGVLTSSSRDLVLPCLEKHFLLESQYLCIQCCEDTVHSKPDSRVFVPILDKLNYMQIAPCEVVYVGDSLNDFFAARSANLNFIGITTGLNSTQDFFNNGAKYITASINNLPDLISLF